MLTRIDAQSRDAQDSLAHKRAAFQLPHGVIYCDGNSLGPLPAHVPARLAEVVSRQWGEDLITSWNINGWIDLPQRVGARIGRLIGAAPGSVICADSTSVNLFKLVSAALTLRPERSVILSDSGNFPTDLYIAEGVSRFSRTRHELKITAPEAVETAIDSSVALLMLTHVDYRTGRMHDMKAITAKAQAMGALVLWDLAHSAGAMALDLEACNVDFAVGCSYKYLNGGPGAPAFAYVAPRHHNQMQSPLSGWMGHAAPFRFELDYRPASGMTRFLCGTPGILGLSALDAALDVFDAVDMQALRHKSVALCDMFIALIAQECGGFGLELASPTASTQRGSQVSLRHPQGFAIIQALIARKVIGDFRSPDVLRFGFCPLYMRFTDVWDMVSHLKAVMQDEEWKNPAFTKTTKVT